MASRPEPEGKGKSKVTCIVIYIWKIRIKATITAILECYGVSFQYTGQTIVFLN